MAAYFDNSDSFEPFSPDDEAKEVARLTYEIRAVPGVYGWSESNDADVRGELDAALRDVVEQYGDELESEIRRTTYQFFGSDVSAQVRFRDGSIVVEILLVVAVLRGVRDFVETLEWYHRQITRLLRRIFGRARPQTAIPFQVVVLGSWTPGRTAVAQMQGHSGRVFDRDQVMTLYLIGSNLLMIATLVVLSLLRLT